MLSCYAKNIIALLLENKQEQKKVKANRKLFASING